MRGGSSPLLSPPTSSSQSAQQRTPSFRLPIPNLLDVSVLPTRSPVKTTALRGVYRVSTADSARKRHCPRLYLCVCSGRDYAPFVGVHLSWLSLFTSPPPSLVCWSHCGSVGSSWRRRAPWTQPWRSSAAVPCTALLCSPPAAIRMLAAFHHQAPQDQPEVN